MLNVCEREKLRPSCATCEEDATDFVQVTLSESLVGFQVLCLELLEGFLKKGDGPEVVKILESMTRRMRDEARSQGNLGDVLGRVFGTDRFRGLLEQMLVIDDESVLVQLCRLMCAVCKYKICVFERDFKEKVLLEHLAMWMASDNGDLWKRARKLAILLCDREVNCAALLPLILRGQNAANIEGVSRFVRMQLHFLEINSGLCELCGVIWRSGNDIARRNLLHGIIWCAQHDVSPVMGLFATRQWVDVFAEYLSSKLYVNVLLVFRAFQSLWPYLDPDSYPDDALMQSTIHEWFTHMSCAQGCGGSMDRHFRVCIAITDFLRQRAEVNTEFAAILIKRDPFLIDNILLRFVDGNCPVREHILRLIVTIIKHAPNADILVLSPEKLLDGMLSMLGYTSEDVASQTLLAIHKTVLAHMRSASPADLPSLFAEYNGREALEPILISNNPENIVLAKEILAELAHDQ